MVWASSRSKKTTASAASAPFLVAPKESTSTPAFQLASAGVQPRRGAGVGQAAGVGRLGEAPHLGRRVHRAHLGGLGEADRPGRRVGAGAGAGLVDRLG